MITELRLTDAQIADLTPFFGMRGDHVLIASIHPAGPGWTLCVRALPGERRDAIAAACRGELQLPRRQSKSIHTTKVKG